MHLYPRRRNVAGQVADEIKTITYATPPMEAHRKTNSLSCAGGKALNCERGDGVVELVERQTHSMTQSRFEPRQDLHKKNFVRVFVNEQMLR